MYIHSETKTFTVLAHFELRKGWNFGRYHPNINEQNVKNTGLTDVHRSKHACCAVSHTVQ